MPPARPPVGDGSGPPVALRLTDRKIERRLVRDPQLATGRSLYGRPAGNAAGPYLRPARSGPEQHAVAANSGLDQGSRRHPLSRAAHAAVQSGSPRAAQRGPSLRHQRRPSTNCSSIATGSTRAAISRRPTIPGDAQLAKKRHIAAKLAIEPGQRVLDIGSRLGRPRAVSGQDGRLRRDRRHAQRRAAQDRRSERAAKEGLARLGALRVQGLSQGRPASSIASSRSACSSTSASTTTPPTSARCAQLLSRRRRRR